jgi:hypothetical protein
MPSAIVLNVVILNAVMMSVLALYSASLKIWTNKLERWFVAESIEPTLSLHIHVRLG